MPALIALVNTVLPVILAAWKSIREQDVNAPTYTDLQVLEMLGASSADIVAKADAWLATHPKT